MKFAFVLLGLAAFCAVAIAGSKQKNSDESSEVYKKDFGRRPFKPRNRPTGLFTRPTRQIRTRPAGSWSRPTGSAWKRNHPSGKRSRPTGHFTRPSKRPWNRRTKTSKAADSTTEKV